MCVIDWSVVGSLLVALLTNGLLVWIFLRTQKRNAEMFDENHRRTVEMMREQSERERRSVLTAKVFETYEKAFREAAEIAGNTIRYQRRTQETLKKLEELKAKPGARAGAKELMEQWKVENSEHAEMEIALSRVSISLPQEIAVGPFATFADRFHQILSADNPDFERANLELQSFFMLVRAWREKYTCASAGAEQPQPSLTELAINQFLKHARLPSDFESGSQLKRTAQEDSPDQQNTRPGHSEEEQAERPETSSE